jgi:hypothetical protein
MQTSDAAKGEPARHRGGYIGSHIVRQLGERGARSSRWTT